MATVVRIMSKDGDGLPSVVQCADDVDQSLSKGPVPCHRPLLRKILKRFQELENTGDDSVLKAQLCGQNFVIAIIGPKGGKISFPDGSVEVDVPPGALSKAQTVYCCRSDDAADGTPWRKGKIFYSIALRLKAEDQKFKKKVLLRFRHFSEFKDERQKKKLAAFVQQTKDSEYEIDNNAGIEIDKEWVMLKVEDFCNRVIGADERVDVPPPALKLLAMSFLSYAEFSKQIVVDLFLLVGPDDPAHMKVLQNLLRQQRSCTLFGQSEIVMCSPEFESFCRQATSGLRFRFRDGHYIAQHQNKEFTNEEINCDANYSFIFQNILKRQHEDGFDSKQPLCSVEIAENENGELSSRADFDITWHGHTGIVEPEESVIKEQKHAPGGLEPPFQVSAVLAGFANEFGLQIRSIQPSIHTE